MFVVVVEINFNFLFYLVIKMVLFGEVMLLLVCCIGESICW